MGVLKWFPAAVHAESPLVSIAFQPVVVVFFEIMTAQGFPTEAASVQGARRDLKFHRDQAGTWRYPRDLGPAEVVASLNHLANDEHVAAGTQNQALNASVFRCDQAGSGERK